MNASETSATASGAAWLEGCECGECDRKYFPKRVFCTECGSRDAMRDARIEGPGKLYSHSIIHIAPKTFKVPYAVGYVDLPGDVRVLAQIFGWEDGSLEQGMEMEIGYAPIAEEPDGSIRESFIFQPRR
ncbi:MAG: OB-fold domain-containing protein [Hoeflea sp.]|uniref:Zn-ribbon domain-containing OB-fold protein n=1 Tax=Hoeflea sp. TaxID=1940281 RepID=UPI00329A2A9F